MLIQEKWLLISNPIRFFSHLFISLLVIGLCVNVSTLGFGQRGKDFLHRLAKCSMLHPVRVYDGNILFNRWESHAMGLSRDALKHAAKHQQHQFVNNADLIGAISVYRAYSNFCSIATLSIIASQFCLI